MRFCSPWLIGNRLSHRNVPKSDLKHVTNKIAYCAHSSTVANGLLCKQGYNLDYVNY